MAEEAQENEMRVLASKKGGVGQEQARFASDDEFEAFWDRLEAQAQAEREAAAAEKALAAERAAQADCDAADGEADLAADPAGVSANSANPVDPAGAYDRLIKAIRNRPLASELMRRTLVLCDARQPYAQVEDAIRAFPEYACAALTPYQVISTLVDAEGLRRVELDAAGEEVLPEQKAGLSDDEADDLVDSYALETTDLGRLAAQDIAPERRLAEVFSAFADRRDVFSELLAFCQDEPRTYRDIEALLGGRDFSNIASLNPQPGVSIQPSVFVDNLERAGGLVWDDGWRLTPAGAMFLEQLVG